MNLTNLILNTDSYKFSHFLQYPPGTKGICAYIETRGHPDQADVVFFGLQMFLKEYLGKPVTSADVDEAEAVVVAHGLPFNRAGWMRIVDHFGGYLPLEIQALPEGTLLRRGVPMVQILNTDPESFWLTSYIETALLRAVWYPSSVASNARKIKQIIRPVLEKTCDDPEAALPFRLHDFGARGVGALEQAGLGRGSPSRQFHGHRYRDRRSLCAALLWRRNGRVLDPRLRTFDHDRLGRGAGSGSLFQHDRSLCRRRHVRRRVG